jgi:hypothetical protein
MRGACVARCSCVCLSVSSSSSSRPAYQLYVRTHVDRELNGWARTTRVPRARTLCVGDAPPRASSCGDDIYAFMFLFFFFLFLCCARMAVGMAWELFRGELTLFRLLFHSRRDFGARESPPSGRNTPRGSAFRSVRMRMSRRLRVTGCASVSSVRMCASWRRIRRRIQPTSV